jgi:hypothetical protein
MIKSLLIESPLIEILTITHTSIRWRLASLDSESAILNTYNRFARSHKALGFLEVHILTDEVQKALEIFEDYDPDDFLEVLEEEANDPEGGRTFVRCCWNNY